MGRRIPTHQPILAHELDPADSILRLSARDKVIYMTNAIESVNMSLRKPTKNRGEFEA